MIELYDTPSNLPPLQTAERSQKPQKSCIFLSRH